MTPREKAIRRFCGRHADWWPSTTQVQEMLALAQPCSTCEALARTVMLDQTSHDTQRQWVGLTVDEIKATWSQLWYDLNHGKLSAPDNEVRNNVVMFGQALEAKLKERNT